MKAAPASGAVVVTSAHVTLAQKTVNLRLSGTITAAGHNVPLSGTGQANLDAQEMAVNAQANANGSSVTFNELIVGGKFYMNFSAGGQSVYQLTGRHWVLMPINLSSTGADLTNGDPLSALRVLESRGASVKPLGVRTIDGRSVTGFSVTPTKAALVAGAQKGIAFSDLTPAERTSIEQSLQQMTPPTITIWVDHSDLVRRMTMYMQLGGGTAVGHGQLSLDFFSYGTPVNISAPSPGDVVPYQDFLKIDQGGYVLASGARFLNVGHFSVTDSASK